MMVHMYHVAWLDRHFLGCPRKCSLSFGIGKKLHKQRMEPDGRLISTLLCFHVYIIPPPALAYEKGAIGEHHLLSKLNSSTKIDEPIETIGKLKLLVRDLAIVFIAEI